MNSVFKSSSTQSLVSFSSCKEKEDVDFREAHLLAWEQSGLSQVEYCRHHNLNSKTFAGWKHRYKKSLLSGTSTAGVKLVELKGPVSSDFSSSLCTGSGGAPPAHLRSSFTPGGLRIWCGEFCIEVGAYFSSNVLSQVAQTLKDLNSVEKGVGG